MARGRVGRLLGNGRPRLPRLGQVEKAIGYYEQRLVIAREIGDRRGEGNALGNLGIGLRRFGQVEKAIGYYEQAVGHRPRDRRPPGRGQRPREPGHCLRRLGQVEKAIGYYEQWLVLHREIGDRRGEGATSGTWASPTPLSARSRRRSGTTSSVW